MDHNSHSQDWKVTFFAIWSGQACSLLGSQLVGFALIWWLTLETGSATVLATAALVSTLPGVFLGPFAGVLVDRWNRRLVMMGADALIAVATLGLALLSAAGLLQPWHVYAIMLIRSLGGTFHWPAMQASTSLMVPKEHLSRVAGMNQALQGAMNIVAPPIGALLLSLLPLHGIMLIDVGTALLAIGPLLFVFIPQPLRQAGPAGVPGVAASLWHDMAEGFRYMWSWAGLCLVGLMSALINMLINPGVTLLPLLVTNHFHGQAQQLAWLDSTFGVGFLAGALGLSVWGGFRRRMLTSQVGVIGAGAGVLLLGVAPGNAFWLALVAAFVCGVSMPLANGPLMAAMQASVAPEMQGRIFTVTISLATAAAPLGLAVAGPVADAIGVSGWLVIGGVACLTLGTAGLLMPAVMRLEEGRPLRPAPQLAHEL